MANFWSAHIDDDRQQFVIKDADGNTVAARNFPSQKSPNPGRTENMKNKQNSDAWLKILNLVESANAYTETE